GNGFHGTLENGAGIGDGRVGQAVELDGNNDFVKVGNVLAKGGSQMSAAAWVFKKDSRSDDRVISKSTDVYLTSKYIWSLGVAGDRVTVRLQTDGKTNSFAGPRISANQWHHLAFSYDGRYVRTFVDGNLASTHGATGLIPSS